MTQPFKDAPSDPVIKKVGTRETHDRPQLFMKAIEEVEYPVFPLDAFIAGDTTPTVKDRRYIKSPNGATVVTQFDDGSEQHTIHILGNGNLTVSNNANIKTSVGAPKVLLANKIYTFTRIEGVWYEHTP